MKEAWLYCTLIATCVVMIATCAAGVWATFLGGCGGEDPLAAVAPYVGEPHVVKHPKKWDKWCERRCYKFVYQCPLHAHKKDGHVGQCKRLCEQWCWLLLRKWRVHEAI